MRTKNQYDWSTDKRIDNERSAYKDFGSTPGGLTKQLQEDKMLSKFNLQFTLANRGMFFSDPNIFHNTDHIVTSIDFISREDILNVALKSHRDLIVVDEVHRLSAYDYGTKVYKSKRYQAAQS